MDFSVGWFVRHGSYFFLAGLMYAFFFWLACFVMNRLAVVRGWLKEGEVSWVPQPKPVKALLMGLSHAAVVMPLGFVLWVRFLEGPGDMKAPLSFVSSYYANIWFAVFIAVAVLIPKFFLRTSIRRSARLFLPFMLFHIPFSFIATAVSFLLFR